MSAAHRVPVAASFTKRLLCAARLFVATVSVGLYCAALSADTRRTLQFRPMPSASRPSACWPVRSGEASCSTLRGSAGRLGGGAGEQQGDVVTGVGAEAGEHAVAQLVQ
jgi:hypothetical protein